VIIFSQIKKATKEFRKLGNDLNKFALNLANRNREKEPPGLSAKELPHAQESDEGRLVIRGHLPLGAPPRRPVKEPKLLQKKGVGGQKEQKPSS
jgi:hypothetical protein